MTLEIQPANRAKAAAKLLGISYIFLLDLCNTGKIRFVRLGRNIIIPGDEIRRVLREGLLNSEAE